MTLLRRFDSAFTDAADLPLFIPSLPVAGIYRRYLATDSDAAVGTAVTSLANRGSASGAATASPAVAPTKRAAGGVTYLEFDGTNDLIAAPTDAALGAGAVTAYGVARFRALPATGHIWPIVSLSALGAQNYGIVTQNNGKAGIYRETAVAVLNSPLPGTDWHVFVGVFNGATSVVRMDGTESGAVTTGTGTMGALGVGPGLSSRPQVDVAEFGMFDRALDATERSNLVAALQAQYGLA